MGIKLLPEDVWSRIAAGEVVERPASAVKEMIENSLDAGARRIRVKLWDGGRVRIVAEDDGAGIAFEELPLALTPHATSKIGAIEDLEAIHTLGYRGEALASLAAVAKVEIRSRPAGRDSADSESAGGVICAYGGRVLGHMRVNCIPGTRVQVDELFANLPARRKFLKSAAGELRRVTTVLREYAICRPEASFALEHDGRPLFSTDGGGERRRAIEQLWGTEPGILAVRSRAGHVELECWWQPHQGRNEVTSFVNGRSVTDPVIKGAVNAARELTGAWALFFSVDPSLIDVNIHPAKAEIRFRHPGEVFEAVKAAAEQLGAPAPVAIHDGRTFSTNSSFNPFNKINKFDKFNKNEDFGASPVKTNLFHQDAGQTQGAGQTRNAGAFHAKQNAGAFRAPRPDRLFGRLELSDSDDIKMPDMQAPDVKMPDSTGQDSATPFNSFDSFDFRVGGETRTESEESALEPPKYLGQLNSGYLVFDAPDGPAIIDPHAAHERVAFERIQAAAKEGKHSQLLTPAPLPPTLQLEAEEKRGLLESAGFALESLEGGLRLTAMPFLPLVNAVSPEALLRASLAALRDSGDSAGRDSESLDSTLTEFLWRAWATMACKAAVKATTKLEPEEALALWRDLHQCRQPFFCPHGRPTILKLSVSELAKHFGRS